MTAKEFVKQRVPNAAAEKHKKGKIKGMQETYWLVREGSSAGYMASGKTEAIAWKAAKLKVLSNTLKDK